MSLEFYKVVHLTGMILLFSGLVTLLTMKITGVLLAGPARKFALMSHGIGLVLILISGFGMAARLNYMQSLPNWIYYKLFVWLSFGGAMTLIKKQGHHWGYKLYTILLVVFITAAYVAVTKPF